VSARTPLAVPALALAALAAAPAGCVKVPYQRADAMSAVPAEPLAEDRLALKWKFVATDRITEISPQEFAAPLVYTNTVYIGSEAGTFYALDAETGELRWKRKLGSMASAPLVDRGVLFLGTADGYLIAVDAQTGKPKWRYQGHGPIEQTPAAAGDLVIFSNEADQVVAIDAVTGKFKWQYKVDNPDQDYTLRGHAGVRVDGDLVYTGFSNGTLAALRRDTGTVAWSTSLKGDADKFTDVDATPIVFGDTVYATSSSGGLYALDKTTGLVRWRVPFWDASQPSATGNVGGLTTDGKRLYVAVADLGTYALDLQGHVLWRVGAHGGGEPGTPVVDDDMVIYTLASAGLYLADRETGNTLEYFDPGDGISAQPTVTRDGRLFVMSNRAILYAFDLD
jgi:outer membrane protein assembly factor BamB